MDPFLSIQDTLVKKHSLLIQKDLDFQVLISLLPCCEALEELASSSNLIFLIFEVTTPRSWGAVRTRQ